MASIQLRQRLTWETLPKPQVIKLFKRDVLIARLASLVDEWKEATQGKPLTEINVYLGFILEDFCNILELNDQEREKVLSEETLRKVII